jgi:hypothetical protein
VFEIVAIWFLGTDTGMEMTNERLIEVDVVDDDDFHDSRRGSLPPSRSHRVLAFTAFLSLLMVPSYYAQSLPLPQYSSHSIPLSIGCVLPPPSDKGGIPTLQDFITETAKYTSQAQLLLWPEGALRFDNQQQKEHAVQAVMNASASNFGGNGLMSKKKRVHSPKYIGMSFEEVIPDIRSGRNRTQRRNGFALINQTGIVFEYYKRHLVPGMLSFI